MPLTHAEIDRLRRLREKKHREAEGCFVVEGEKVVGELVAAGFPGLEVYATSESVLLGRDLRVRELTLREMARVSHFPTPSPALAVGRLQHHELAPGELGQGLSLALDAVQDAGNVGTLLRIADWFGFSRVLLSPECADLHSQKVINASMGSFSRVRALRVDLSSVLGEVAGALPVIGCDLTGEPVTALEPLEHAVVVVGSEGRGLSPAVASRVTRRVTIPRFGRAESLNAAVAAGIVCSHVRLARA
jgi:RNA methyltransferase, TrmH family